MAAPFRKNSIVLAPSRGQVVYSLYDDFSQALSASSVNGSLSTSPFPTGGGVLRTTVETDGNFAISNGVLNITTPATPGYGKLYLVYPSQNRIAGKLLLATFNPSLNKYGAFGWNNDATPGDPATTNCVYLFFEDTLRLGVTSIGGTDAVVGVYTTGTAYRGTISQRAVGAFYFVKGGAFVYNILLWVSATGSQVANYPAFSDFSQSGTLDNLSLPDATYHVFLPTPIVYDTFTRSDGSLGSSETTGPDSQLTPALSWTGSTWTISTNKAVNTPNLGTEKIVNGGFDADTDWTKGSGWSIAAGVAAAVAASSDITAAVAPLTVGTWYQVTYTISGFSAGTVNAKLGSTAFPTHASNSTYTETGLALTTAFALTATGFTGSIDNVTCKPLTLSELFATISPPTADYILDINATLVSATDGKQVGIVCNLNSAASPTDFRLITLDGRGNCMSFDCIAGTYTVKQTTAITYSAGATLRAILDATQAQRFYNNAQVGTTQTMGANTNKLCGIFSTSPLSSLDVWIAWARGTGNEYGALDAF